MRIKDLVLTYPYRLLRNRYIAKFIHLLLILYTRFIRIIVETTDERMAWIILMVVMPIMLNFLSWYLDWTYAADAIGFPSVTLLFLCFIGLVV